MTAAALAELGLAGAATLDAGRIVAVPTATADPAAPPTPAAGAGRPTTAGVPVGTVAGLLGRLLAGGPPYGVDRCLRRHRREVGAAALQDAVSADQVTVTRRRRGPGAEPVVALLDPAAASAARDRAGAGLTPAIDERRALAGLALAGGLLTRPGVPRPAATGTRAALPTVAGLPPLVVAAVTGVGALLGTSGTRPVDLLRAVGREPRS